MIVDAPAKSFMMWQTLAPRLALLAVLLSACNFHINARDREAIKAVTELIMGPEVTAPSAESGSVESGNETRAQLPVHGIMARNTIRYLRSRRQQGIDLKFRIGSRTDIDEHISIVTVRVEESGSGKLISEKVSYSFNVKFEQKENAPWQLTSISADS